MDAWAAENVPAVDVDFATQKFFDYYAPEKRSFNNWKLWMRNERPATGGGVRRSMNASEKLEESLRGQSPSDFDDVDEEGSLRDSMARLFGGNDTDEDAKGYQRHRSPASQRRVEEYRRKAKVDLFADVTD
jgi:hypothetical protein